jgi:hypothetical protein
MNNIQCYSFKKKIVLDDDDDDDDVDDDDDDDVDDTVTTFWSRYDSTAPPPESGCLVRQSMCRVCLPGVVYSVVYSGKQLKVERVHLHEFQRQQGHATSQACVLVYQSDYVQVSNAVHMDCMQTSVKYFAILRF